MRLTNGRIERGRDLLNDQRKKKNGISWTDFTWNPVSGCLHGCPYCYMNPLWRRFPDLANFQFKREYLKDRFPKKPSRIFVGTSTDMWGLWVPRRWIQKVLDVVRGNPQHTFLFLTKNPEKYGQFDLPGNGWYGVTVESADLYFDRAKSLLDNTMFKNRFLSFEPLLGEIPIWLADICCVVDWIIIGADSTRGARKPPKEWADTLISAAREYNVPVWMKDNYGYPEVIKEFPRGR